MDRWKSFVADNSALAQLGSLLMGHFTATQVYPLGHIRDPLMRKNWTRRGLRSGYRALLKGRLEEMKERVRTLVEASKSMGSKPIFISQVRRSYRKPNGHVEGIDFPLQWTDGEKINGMDEFHMMGLINEALLQVAQENEAGFIDLAQKLSFEEEDFYDISHNTPQGAAKIGHFLATAGAARSSWSNSILFKRNLSWLLRSLSQVGF